MTVTSNDRHRLGVLGGLAALSLDAMASVAYGPEAIVLVLALGGASDEEPDARTDGALPMLVSNSQG